MRVGAWSWKHVVAEATRSGLTSASAPDRRPFQAKIQGVDTQAGRAAGPDLRTIKSKIGSHLSGEDVRTMFLRFGPISLVTHVFIVRPRSISLQPSPGSVSGARCD